VKRRPTFKLIVGVFAEEVSDGALSRRWVHRCFEWNPSGQRLRLNRPPHFEKYERPSDWMVGGTQGIYLSRDGLPVSLV